MRKMRITRQPRYEHQFKADAVALLERSERPVAELAASLGVGKNTLYSWYNRAMGKKGKKRDPASQAETTAETPERKLARLEAENATLKKRVASLEEDKEILKKFAAFSVREKT